MTVFLYPSPKVNHRYTDAVEETSSWRVQKTAGTRMSQEVSKRLVSGL